MAKNDFAPGNVPVYPPQQVEAYADPAPGGPWHSERAGYADGLRRGLGTTPDVQRIGQYVGADTYEGTDPEHFARERNAVQLEREAYLSEVRPILRDELTAGAPRFAPNPRSIPVPRQRVTESQAPSSGAYVRDMNAGLGQRYFTGEHRSMANRKREYEIFGMRPASTSRTTFRREILPQTVSVVEKPADSPQYQIARVNAVGVPSRRGRFIREAVQ